MLIKLDSGDYINTEYVSFIGTDVGGDIRASLVGDDPDTYMPFTPADLDRTIKAMSGHPVRTDDDLPDPYAWETKEGGLRYDREAVADYNSTYHNSIGIEDSLYTVDQMREALGIGGNR